MCDEWIEQFREFDHECWREDFLSTNKTGVKHLYSTDVDKCWCVKPSVYRHSGFNRLKMGDIKKLTTTHPRPANSKHRFGDIGLAVLAYCHNNIYTERLQSLHQANISPLTLVTLHPIGIGGVALGLQLFSKKKKKRTNKKTKKKTKNKNKKQQ